MKTFRLIGMALFAVLMCVNFAACSNNDDPTKEKEEENKRKTKKIVEVNCNDYDIYHFKYDSKGKLSSCTSTHGRNRKRIHEYSWNENIVKETAWWEDEENKKSTSNYTLKNGIVTLCDYDGQYFYNESKQLIFSPFENENLEFTWEGNKLQEAYNEKFELKYIYSYGSNDHCTGYNILFPVEYFGNPIHMAHPEIFGIKTTELPYKIDSNKKTHSYTYTLDEEGYIIKIKATGTYESNYTFKWE